MPAVDCRVSVVVDAGREATWDRLADIPGWPAWNPACLEAGLDGPRQPGTVMRLRLRHPKGRDFYTRPRLAEVDRPRRLAWETRSVGVRARTEVEVSPEIDGTRVTLTAGSGGPMGFSYRWAMRPRTQALIWSRMLDGLAGSFR